MGGRRVLLASILLLTTTIVVDTDAVQNVFKQSVKMVV
jgi:hypothetical protein